MLLQSFVNVSALESGVGTDQTGFERGSVVRNGELTDNRIVDGDGERAAEVLLFKGAFVVIDHHHRHCARMK